jgi:ABC-type Fe3+ transport system permease subunit
LHLLAPAVARAAGISAAVSLGEFGATSFLTRGDTKTVPIVIGELMGRPGPLLQQSAFAIATLILSVFSLGPTTVLLVCGSQDRTGRDSHPSCS